VGKDSSPKPGAKILDSSRSLPFRRDLSRILAPCFGPQAPVDGGSRLQMAPKAHYRVQPYQLEKTILTMLESSSLRFDILRYCSISLYLVTDGMAITRKSFSHSGREYSWKGLEKSSCLKARTNSQSFVALRLRLLLAACKFAGALDRAFSLSSRLSNAVQGCSTLNAINESGAEDDGTESKSNYLEVSFHSGFCTHG
jgi:hypothetical protein